MIWLLALLLQQSVAPPSIPTPSVPVKVLPEEPQSHFLKDAASHVALIVSSRKVGKLGRVYSGGVSIELDPHLTVSGGYESTGWAAGAIIHPVPKKK